MSKKDSIELSPKYGVNPTIPLCFWCGRKKDEIALLGRIRKGQKNGDFEAPRYSVINYQPCDICQGLMDQGVTLIEATDAPRPPYDYQAPMQENVYPTGRWSVVKKDAAKKLFNVEDQPIIFVDKELYDSLYFNKEEAESCT